MKPATRRVLRALQAAGGRGMTTHDLCQPHVGGVRFSARLYEIRAEGYQIKSQRERAGSTRYVLIDPPELERFGGEAA